MTASSPGPSTRPAPALSPRLLLGGVLLLTFLIYVPALRYGWVYDDHPQIVLNPWFQSPHTLGEVMSGNIWKQVYPQMSANYYRPVFLAWMWGQARWFGLEPAGWHAASLFLHLLATALVFFVCRRLGYGLYASGFVAAVFGVHPVHIEAVAWVSGVTEPLYAVFLLAGFLSYLWWRERRNWYGIAVIAGFYMAAMLAKETGAVLLLLIAGHAWIHRKDPVTTERSLLPMFVVLGQTLALYAGIRQGILGTLANNPDGVPGITALLTAPGSLWFYVKQLLLPLGLSEFYDQPYVARASAMAFVIPVACLALIALGLCTWARSRPRVGMAAAFIFLPLAPVLSATVFPLQDFVHDRYLYLSVLGLGLLIAEAGLIQNDGPSRSRLGLSALLVALLAAGTMVQSGIWSSDLALYERGYRVAPENPKVTYNLGITYLTAGRDAEGLALLQETLRRFPEHEYALYALGYHAYQSGALREAEEYLSRVLALDARNGDAHMYRGLARYKLGHTVEGLVDVRQAVQLLPRKPGFHFALGLLLDETGDRAGACREYQEESRLQPGLPALQGRLAACMAPAVP
jgi:Flp pilus assembly protein TadD